MAIHFPLHLSFFNSDTTASSVRETIKTVKVLSKKAQNVASVVLKEMQISFFAGAANLFASFVVVNLLPSKITQIGQGDMESYRKALTFTNVVVIAPVIEEILFRGIIQKGLTHLARSVLPNKAVVLHKDIQMPLADLVALVATSVLFGAVHLSNETGLAQVIAATIGGLVFGLLANQRGLHSSIGAHMTNNGIAYGLIKLAGQ